MNTMPTPRDGETPTLPQWSVSTFRANSPNLDLIRAAAVLSVFFGHLSEIISGHESLLAWHFAQMGVLIFFVHTSMVLMLSLERAKLQGWAIFGDFYLRRFFRLYPLSMFCVTIAMLLSRSPDSHQAIRHWTLLQYLSNLALTTNLTYTDAMVGGLWTLPLEVQMYLALPFLNLIGRGRGVAALFGLWVCSIPLALLQPHISGRMNVLAYAPCFIAGVIAWRLSHSLKRRLPGWLWPFGFVAIWPLFFIASHENDMYYRWAFCMALALIIPIFREVGFPPITTAAHFVAKYSYGIYLSHIAIMLFCFGLPLPFAGRWAFFVFMAPTCPIAMFHFIEHPMILTGQRLARRSLGRAR